MLIAKENIRIAVIGLGYVGLPVALAFAAKYPTVGFDINQERLQTLREQQDTNNELSSAELEQLRNISFTSETDAMANSNVYIVTVPTPIDEHLRPDFMPLIAASQTISQILKAGDIVIYESTVYPGAIEEVCVPILAKSGLKYNEEFFAGYSPERINPGDKHKQLTDILKVTSGSTPYAADFVDFLYGSIIKAGTHKVSCMQVAEAAKVIENTQRDLNIALINELAMIFNKLNLNTEEVLAAAATKWNFMHFKPGLVGGHCIGVDPYYLTFKAQAIGYNPEVILAGRRINDNMGAYVAGQVVKKMLSKKIHVRDAEVLILGFAFKENCTDSRNTKVIDIVHELNEYGARVSVYDPLVNPNHVWHEYGIKILSGLQEGNFEAIIIAVAHDEFKEMDIDSVKRLGKKEHVIYDIKHLFPADVTDGRL